MAEDTTIEEILTDDEVATLNEARSILHAFGNRCRAASWNAPALVAGIANPADLGRVHGMADAAEHAIFMALNSTSSYDVRKLDEAQLHNHKVAAQVAVEADEVAA